ncbi:hypothetical protein ACIP4Y_37765 [Streptomyces sp. NPDC088810]
MADRPVTLTFHFWSGASVTYHVTRSGTTVTGSNQLAHSPRPRVGGCR